MSRAPHTVKTHFADEATLEHMAKLERENARLREALETLENAASFVPVISTPSNDLSDFRLAIIDARAALEAQA